MATDRRTALMALGAGLTGLAGAALFPWGGKGARAGGPAAFLSARRDPAGRHHASLFSAAGNLMADVPLPGRGHGFALDAGRHVAVAFARRPGRFAVVFDLRRGTVRGAFATPDNRHFYGHGAVSPDGRLLYAPENDFEAKRGVIGIYRLAPPFARIGEMASHDIGPHDLRLLGDGRTMVVANGGILTHPDLPRMKLNIADMNPSLCFLDRQDGRLLRRIRLDRRFHQASIRHLALSPRGDVAFANQYEGPRGDLVPLAGVVRKDGALRLFGDSVPAIRALRQYGGSISFDRTGDLLAVSSPRGDTVSIWSVADGQARATPRIPDVCGLCPAPGRRRFMASSGRGGVFEIDGLSGKTRRLDGASVLARSAWDNHMFAVAT